ncbi:CHAT domain-containing tetratricopeptide repeat protein [Limnoraphis robusta]|uniref:CHAT domain-containing tetratricopeptide repeat protein n=1 Tax=Limnoraphis robusta CCNP1315 TaxID=3110306 RepID=A0ABU5TZY0_9CYAN|nr:CHAT domain-containing tetratricopeptide repeat protein [Limnoraphis robusta]MEA5520494.1 CHAT domain-containing tetratricopeptide repeat protein [Limnoraphis robusta CCNP1315]MEA5547007.1 CHAT domain-containing tetratricopeptide repeat protein [Limnoraphis robusta CCNP1324]
MNEEQIEVYYNFLMQVLHAVLDSNGDPNIVYPLLQQNLDKLDENLGYILKDWASKTLFNLPLQEADKVPAVILFTFSHLIAEFPLGNRSHNLEIAIIGYKSILGLYTREAFPYEWAMTQNNLGIVYSERIQGDKADNLELAIDAYTQALQVSTREAFPEDWAMTQNNLGNAYRERIKGDKADNLEQAIDAYKQALQVRTREAFPQDWAMTQNNLGLAYSERIKEDKADNLKQAIDACTEALKVYTREAFPYEWAMTQNNLGNAYSQRIEGDKADNLEQAIDAYTEALKVYTREAFPYEWARTQNNLGNAYSERIQGDKADNLQQAFNAYTAFQNALQVHTLKTFPLDCLQTSWNLGDLALKQGDWQLAIEAYDLAIESIEITRNWARTDKRRQEILAESIDVYANMIQACINQSHLEQKQGKLQQAQDLLEKALETSERYRCRQLADLFAVRDLYPDGNIPPEIEQYNQLQQQIYNLRDRYSSDNTRQLTEAGTHSQTRAQFEAETEEIKRLEDEKKKIWEKIRSYDPVLAGQLQVDPLEIKDIQALITDETTALLSFYSTDNDTYIFILRNVGEKLENRLVNLHICKNQGIETLQNWIYDNWFTPYCNRKNSKLWWENMTEFLAELSERLQLKSLVDEHLTGIEELIIVPHLSLHQIPFAALPIEPKPTTPELSDEINSPSGEFYPEETTREFTITPRISQPKTPVKVTPKPSEYLGDRFRLRVVPSCQILNFCSRRDPISSAKMGIVENATGDLVFTEYECKILSQLYQVPDSQRLYFQNATFENYQNLIKNVQFIHSSHHASSRLDNPLDSKLTLYEGEVTLSHLLTWRLPELSDVFLSCCETHFTLTQITDDTLTLAAGFLCAGARSVVSTLWAVDDLSTALFCLFYYQNIQQNFTRSEALQKAQVQLRTLTGKQLEEKYKAELDNYLLKQQAEENRDKIWNHQRDLLSLCKQEFPFSSPYYWAGFVSQGLS